MPRLIPVDDAFDPRLEPYRMVRERDLVGRRGGFIAEGEVVLRVLLRDRRHRPDSLLLAQKRAEQLAPLLAELDDEVPVYVAPQDVLDGVVGFHIHRGILAHGLRAPEPAPDDLLSSLGPRGLVVALFGLSNHDNVGGVFRNAAAFGVHAVLLDPTCCDPLYRKAIRVSVGAALAVPFTRVASAEAALELFARHGFEPLALSPSGATPLAGLARSPRAAVLLGAEGPGLPDEVLRRCRAVGIPMAGAFDSLNVATTSGIVLHHLVFGGG